MLSHTVTEVIGTHRVAGVKAAEIDETLNPRQETERFIPCDTLLLSVGLIPENELTRKMGIAIVKPTNGPQINQYMQTEFAPVFACGNVLHVTDLVDNVSVESARAGFMAASYAAKEMPGVTGQVKTLPGANVRYLCPQRLDLSPEPAQFTLHYRVQRPLKKVQGELSNNGRIVKTFQSLRMNPGEMEHLLIDSSGLEAGELIPNIKEGK